MRLEVDGAGDPRGVSVAGHLQHDNQRAVVVYVLNVKYIFIYMLFSCIQTE